MEAELEELVDREERLIKVLNPNCRQALVVHKLTLAASLSMVQGSGRPFVDLMRRAAGHEDGEGPAAAVRYVRSGWDLGQGQDLRWAAWVCAVS